MKRRSFITALGAIPTVVVGWFVFKRLNPTSIDVNPVLTKNGYGKKIEDKIKYTILKYLPYLSIHDDVISTFTGDLYKAGHRFPTDKSVNLKVARRFLLSTDYIQSGENSNRPVKYVSLFDPYYSPCYNPFHL